MASNSLGGDWISKENLAEMLISHGIFLLYRLLDSVPQILAKYELNVKHVSDSLDTKKGTYTLP